MHSSFFKDHDCFFNNFGFLRYYIVRESSSINNLNINNSWNHKNRNKNQKNIYLKCIYFQNLVGISFILD